MVAAWPVSRAPETGELDVAGPAPSRDAQQRAPEHAGSEAQPTAAIETTTAPRVRDSPAEPAAVEPPSSVEAPDREAEADQIFVRENGPLAEYKQRFASEPRDSAAHDAEQALGDAFKSTDGRGQVFRSALCRETICRVEVRISTANLGAYVAAMARIVHQGFDSKLATERTSLAEGGEVSVFVYAKRRPQPP
jgi:hypothetical protein